jgi:chromatin remodeling complex protein RSC6
MAGKKTTKPSVASAQKKTKAPAKVSAPEPVIATASVATPAENEVIQETNIVTESMTDFWAKLQQISSLMGELRTEYRTLEKKMNREIKAATKASQKRKRKLGNRQPSGFVKPTPISLELATFLGKQAGTEMARTEVTREINSYIREHSLQDKTNGRKINPDQKLTKLLRIPKGDELTYFNLQRYMSPHFQKAADKKKLEAAAAVVTK